MNLKGIDICVSSYFYGNIYVFERVYWVYVGCF